jgi:hypothetical protein
MVELVSGALAAIVASALFSGGLFLQSLEARTVPRERSQIATLGLLVRRRRWVLGALAMVVGFGFHVTALLLAPLTVVQPALAAGLVLLLVAGSRVDAIPIGAREVAGVAALTIALVVLTLTSPERTTVSADTAALALWLGALAVISLIPVLAPGAGGLVAAAGAGTAYALTGITTKLASDRLAAGDVAELAFWLVATATAAVVALVGQTVGLQRSPATQVGVFVYVLPVVVPVVLAPVLVGENWSETPGGGVPLGIALAAVCAAAGVLATSRQVADDLSGPSGAT